jgi:hypothetical protein
VTWSVRTKRTIQSVLICPRGYVSNEAETLSLPGNNQRHNGCSNNTLDCIIGKWCKSTHRQKQITEVYKSACLYIKVELLPDNQKYSGVQTWKYKSSCSPSTMETKEARSKKKIS